MKVRKYVLGFLLAASAAVAFAAASPTRLSDFVLIGNGINTLKWLKFDVGLGAGNPMIQSTSIGVLGLSTDGTNFMVVPAASDTIVGVNTSNALQNKTLNNTNSIHIGEANFKIEQTGGATHTAQFGLAALSTARTYSLQDASGTLAYSDVGNTFSGTQFFAGTGTSHVFLNDVGNHGGNVPHQLVVVSQLAASVSDVYLCCDGTNSTSPLTCNTSPNNHFAATGGGCNAFNIHPLFSNQPIVVSSMVKGWHCGTDGPTSVTAYVICSDY